MKNETKKPTVFLQTRPTTCGVACLMMVLNGYFQSLLTPAEEGRLRKKLKLNRFDLIPAVSLALYLKEQGLIVRIRHDYPEKFWDKLKSFPEDLVEQLHKKHLIAKQKGIVIETGPIEATEVARQLEEGSYLIWGTETGEGVKHAILLFGISDGNVSAIDPLIGEVVYPIDILLARAKMDVGSWYIATSPNN